MHQSTNRGNAERRAELERRDCLCSRCRPNGGENAGRRARPDKYKDRRNRRRG